MISAFAYARLTPPGQTKPLYAVACVSFRFQASWMKFSQLSYRARRENSYTLLHMPFGWICQCRKRERIHALIFRI